MRLNLCTQVRNGAPDACRRSTSAITSQSACHAEKLVNQRRCACSVATTNISQSGAMVFAYHAVKVQQLRAQHSHASGTSYNPDRMLASKKLREIELARQ